MLHTKDQEKGEDITTLSTFIQYCTGGPSQYNEINEIISIKIVKKKKNVFAGNMTL